MPSRTHFTKHTVGKCETTVGKLKDVPKFSKNRTDLTANALTSLDLQGFSCTLLGLTENGPRKKEDPVSDSSVGENPC